MNRLKKELRKKGFRLESDYPVLPYLAREGQYNSLYIDGVYVNSELAIITIYYNVDVCSEKLNRDGSLTAL